MRPRSARDANGPLSAATAWAGATFALATVIYASLYPFEGWRDESPAISEWLLSPWPKYWTGWDLWVNWLGYVPLGAALALCTSRLRRSVWRALGATLLASALSLGLESVQSLMVHRVASNLDWVFNTLGAVTGVAMVHMALQSRWLQIWGRWRRGHLAAGAGLMLSVLVLWLLLLPLPMLLPFAVGRLPPTASAWLWTQVSAWLPAAEAINWPLAWSTLPLEGQVVAMVVVLLAPLSLLRFTWRDPVARLWVVWLWLGLAVLVPTVAHVVSHGWTHAGDWLLPPVAWALGAVALLAPLTMLLPRVIVVGLTLLLLGAQWLGVNVLAETGYWSFHWAAFEQGRFVRWYGLLAWLTVVWPAVAMALVVRGQWMSRS